MRGEKKGKDQEEREGRMIGESGEREGREEKVTTAAPVNPSLTLVIVKMIEQPAGLM